MKIADLADKNVVIWGTGREGQAAAALLRDRLPDLPLTFVDENGALDISSPFGTVVTGADRIAATLARADVVIKSPGVSLYHPLIVGLKEKGVHVTSLLNLWCAEPRQAKLICVTGTKGKSTTSSLIAHMLGGLGKKALLLGNIGQAVGTQDDKDAEYIILEMSSYQSADFTQSADIAVLTSLYPEHLDWHRTLAQYYRDKVNMLRVAKTRVINTSCLSLMQEYGLAATPFLEANTETGIHVRGGQIFNGQTALPDVQNPYVQRAHNLVNLCMALTVLDQLGFDVAEAIATLGDFNALPHRQQELGVRGDILYVDDSISTTPQSAIAAMEAYRHAPITLIAGGHDRGIDYAPLVSYIKAQSIHAVVCMGPSGARIFDALHAQETAPIFKAASMAEAVAWAQQNTPPQGTILLSPAAPSYGLFKDFTARGQAFAEACGFDVRR